MPRGKVDDHEHGRREVLRKVPHDTFQRFDSPADVPIMIMSRVPRLPPATLCVRVGNKATFFFALSSCEH